jgi:hydrogenase small subunit
MPGFPDKFMPFMAPDRWGNAAANFQRFTYGPIFRYFRKRNVRLKYDQEPAWRAAGPTLETGYEPRWDAGADPQPQGTMTGHR